jgi:hypothetical protein
MKYQASQLDYLNENGYTSYNGVRIGWITLRLYRETQETRIKVSSFFYATNFSRSRVHT